MAEEGNIPRADYEGKSVRVPIDVYVRKVDDQLLADSLAATQRSSTRVGPTDTATPPSAPASQPSPEVVSNVKDDVRWQLFMEKMNRAIELLEEIAANTAASAGGTT